MPLIVGQAIKKAQVRIDTTISATLAEHRHDHLGNTGRKTGFWLEELAAPYYVFEDAGAPLSPESPINGTR
jgi:hypothetical protein